MGVLITIIVFIAMEGITWLTHKYIMHGFLWALHKDHHQPGYPHILEKNDLFFVIFAIPSILLFYFGVEGGINYLFFIGLGILLYGIAYFIFHEVIIHRRLRWFERSNNKYIKGIRKAHKIHHKQLDKHNGECFGMLLVPFKYFKM